MSSFKFPAPEFTLKSQHVSTQDYQPEDWQKFLSRASELLLFFFLTAFISSLVTVINHQLLTDFLVLLIVMGMIVVSLICLRNSRKGNHKRASYMLLIMLIGTNTALFFMASPPTIISSLLGSAGISFLALVVSGTWAAYATTGWSSLCLIFACATGHVFISRDLNEIQFRPEIDDVFFLICIQFLIVWGGSFLLNKLKKANDKIATSQEKFQKLFHTTPVGMVIIRKSDGYFLEANKAFLMFLGYEYDELIMRPYYEFQLWTDPADHKRLAAHLKSGTTEHGLEIKLLNRGGSERIGLISSETVEIGGAECLLLSILDITERKRYEEELAAEKERLDVTLRSIGDGVIATDTSGKIILFNRAAEEQTGLSQAAVTGQPLSAILHLFNPQTRVLVQPQVSDLIRQQVQVQQVEPLLLVTKSGAERYVTYNLTPLHAANGSCPIGAVLVILDVTEKLKLEKEQQKARNLESLGVLAGGIAHDYNNILTAILGNISIARLTYDNPEELDPILDEAEKATFRASELTQQLLTFARGGAPIKRMARLEELIQDTTSFVLRGSNIRNEINLEPDLWPVEVDSGQISRVIQNLVLNGVQAMPYGGVLRVSACNIALLNNEVSFLEEGRYIKIVVQDQGKGIKREDLPHIFDPYYTTKPGGSGLGLAICYSIIKRHGGQIIVDSDWQKGTAVEVYLPVVPVVAMAGVL